jgi:hypothetical protein
MKMANKKKTMKKWFRVAVAGDTTDGREIQASWLTDIVETYNTEKYGARINCEHIKGYSPESGFGAFGDITAVKIENFEVDGENKIALYAEVDPTDELVALNKKRQKVYSSIEVNPNFANSGKAYLMGMAITDSPASLGTEMMEFCSKNADSNPLSNRKTTKECLFTASQEIDMEFSEIDVEDQESKEKFSTKIKAMFTKNKKQTTEDFADVQNAIEAIAGEVTELSEKIPVDQSEKVTELTEKLSTMKTEFDEFKAEVDGIELHGTRPPATGGKGTVQTDC